MHIQSLQHRLHLLPAEPPRRLPGFQDVTGRHQREILRDNHVHRVVLFLACRRGALEERRGQRVARDAASVRRRLDIQRWQQVSPGDTPPLHPGRHYTRGRRGCEEQLDTDQDCHRQRCHPGGMEADDDLLQYCCLA